MKDNSYYMDNDKFVYRKNLDIPKKRIAISSIILLIIIYFYIYKASSLSELVITITSNLYNDPGYLLLYLLPFFIIPVLLNQAKKIKYNKLFEIYYNKNTLSIEGKSIKFKEIKYIKILVLKREEQTDINKLFLVKKNGETCLIEESRNYNFICDLADVIVNLLKKRIFKEVKEENKIKNKINYYAMANRLLEYLENKNHGNPNYLDLFRELSNRNKESMIKVIIDGYLGYIDILSKYHDELLILLKTLENENYMECSEKIKLLLDRENINF